MSSKRKRAPRSAFGVEAGGRGQRLYPFTAALPKPLMPIGDKPILEHIILRLHQFGIRDIVLAVNHLAPLIETYFGDGSRLGSRISYLREDSPVGTAGPIALLPELNDCLLVMNADVICDIDFTAFIRAHRGSKATITVASSRHESGWLHVQIIPYGTDQRLAIIRDVTNEKNVERTRRVSVLDGL